jgi:hypothetical protein
MTVSKSSIQRLALIVLGCSEKPLSKLDIYREIEENCCTKEGYRSYVRDETRIQMVTPTRIFSQTCIVFIWFLEPSQPNIYKFKNYINDPDLSLHVEQNHTLEVRGRCVPPSRRRRSG